MRLQSVSDILWKERQLLELLLFKLEEEQLVLSSGSGRWLELATREVEMVLEQIRHGEVVRSMEVQQLASELGLTDHRLQAICDAVDAPWDGILRDHRSAFLELAQQVHTVAEANRELLLRANHATREALAWIEEGDDELYSSHGEKTPASSARLFDGAI